MIKLTVIKKNGEVICVECEKSDYVNFKKEYFDEAINDVTIPSSVQVSCADIKMFKTGEVNGT